MPSAESRHDFDKALQQVDLKQSEKDILASLRVIFEKYVPKPECENDDKAVFFRQAACDLCILLALKEIAAGNKPTLEAIRKQLSRTLSESTEDSMDFKLPERAESPVSRLWNRLSAIRKETPRQYAGIQATGLRVVHPG